jgi:preprotein translocase subunit SecE
MARAPVSKTGCWGFESLLACHFSLVRRIRWEFQVFEKVREFLADAKSELSKVTWPSRKDTYASTLAVILLVLFSAVFLWVVDTALSTSIRAVL